MKRSRGNVVKMARGQSGGAGRPTNGTAELATAGQPEALSSGATVPKKTRDRLLDEARNILEESGYAAASVQAIAERAGVAAGTLYRHFPSKADLFVELVREAANRDMGAMKAAASSGATIERLEAIVATFARRALRKPRLAWALVYEPVDPAVDAERLVYRREYCRRMAKLLRQGIAAGEIPAQNVELSAAAIVGAIAESMVGPLSPIGVINSEEELIASLVRFCRRSLGVSDKPALRSVTARNASGRL
jgi:AcrR family transcriptional regulator